MSWKFYLPVICLALALPLPFPFDAMVWGGACVTIWLVHLIAKRTDE